MKQITTLVLLVLGLHSMAQNQTNLKTHYEAFYKQMKAQGDARGIIDGLTHLNILDPSTKRQDTLAYVYMSEGMYMQALNTIGVEKNTTDSDLAVEIKAVSLKAIGQSQKAIEHFDVLFKRNPSTTVAYELAELNMQNQNLIQATTFVDYGLENSKDDMYKAYYETQQPYRVPLKAGFLYLKALVTFNKNKSTNIDKAITFLDEALALAPNFNLAQLSKDALIGQKPKTED
ncbi:tetratricopeptide repeat protein [Mangrovimonas spongiae]|uniref:Tetratricopeptide repeat protein n=1 Tax=Mangrovimonas spongiae TaxID=2494697 RepID=A0A3R9NQN6_9FLAO|nr:hypothetical protein [Mangrovimonas spongiae]RSK41358.1 hypothetical protein EJA19_00350 [Mangrovimonas spongiae]